MAALSRFTCFVRSLPGDIYLTLEFMMNLDLEERLAKSDIAHERLAKKDKVKLLTRWVQEFPELVASARRQELRKGVYRDQASDDMYGRIPVCNFFILPDDDSGMPSYTCVSARPPDLSELVSDTFTKCDELVVVEAGFRWSAVFVNHGAPQLAGRHFSRKSNGNDDTI